MKQQQQQRTNKMHVLALLFCEYIPDLLAAQVWRILWISGGWKIKTFCCQNTTVLNPILWGSFIRNYVYQVSTIFLYIWLIFFLYTWCKTVFVISQHLYIWITDIVQVAFKDKVVFYHPKHVSDRSELLLYKLYWKQCKRTLCIR